MSSVYWHLANLRDERNPSSVRHALSLNRVLEIRERFFQTFAKEQLGTCGVSYHSFIYRERALGLEQKTNHCHQQAKLLPWG